MDSDHHRKIELQSPEDLRYLIDNVSRRAREKIDLNLPPSAAPEGEDALRRRVEELVHEVSKKTTSTSPIGEAKRGGERKKERIYRADIGIEIVVARHNSTCNRSSSSPATASPSTAWTPAPYPRSSAGRLKVSSFFFRASRSPSTHAVGPIEFEPYDRRLHSRVQVLQSSLESSTLSLSSLRREAPAAAADAYVRRSNEQAAATTAAVAALNAAATGTADAAQPALLDLKPLERQADVERAYGTGLEELGALKSRLPATAARLERAKDAAEYVEKSR
jgi:kinetochor protein Mis14/NSL1